MTDVWVFATDGAGEYARWQVPVSVGVGSAPYVVSAMAPGDMVLREDAQDNTDIDFSTTFMAGAAPDPNPTGVGGGDLEYKIETSDASAAKVGTAPDVTYIVPSMVATVSGAGTKLNIRPRAPGVITFKVTATDKGEMCRLRDTSTEPILWRKRQLMQFFKRLLIGAWRLTALRMIPPGSRAGVMGYTGTAADDIASPPQKLPTQRKWLPRKLNSALPNPDRIPSR